MPPFQRRRCTKVPPQLPATGFSEKYPSMGASAIIGCFHRNCNSQGRGTFFQTFTENTKLSSTFPKILSEVTPDIDSYAPYISAVFGSISPEDPRYIPFTAAEQNLKEVTLFWLRVLKTALPLISAFMNVSDVMELSTFTLKKKSSGSLNPICRILSTGSTGSGNRWGLVQNERSRFLSNLPDLGKEPYKDVEPDNRLRDAKRKFMENRENGIGEKKIKGRATHQSLDLQSENRTTEYSVVHININFI